MIVVRDQKGKEIECLGVWATPKKKFFHALSGSSTAWGYGEDYPFTPEGVKEFKSDEYVRLKLNDGYTLANI